nr:hypothetical protein [uncultured Allomuricauda sp.]
MEDGYGTDAALYIISVFDRLLEYTKHSEEIYEAFEAFYFGHNTLFTTEIQNLDMST